jgi:cytochrome c oxidase subunit 3
MATVYHFPPKVQQREAGITNYVGIVLFLASWTVLFAGLFFSYGLLRLKSSHWPPEGVPTLPLFLPGVATIVLLVSSLALWWGMRQKSRAFFIATLFLGILFLLLQSITWVNLWERGLQLDSGAYGGVFYLMTSFHALHIVGGLLALLCFLPAALKLGLDNVPGLRPAALFWHFIDLVWCLMFFTVYVV